MQKRESINISSLKVRKCNGTECEKRRAMCHGALETDTKLLWGWNKGFWYESLFTYLLLSFEQYITYSQLNIYTSPMIILKYLITKYLRKQDEYTQITNYDQNI